MKVLLVNPQRYKSYRPNSVPLGILSIATYLNANGHEAVIYDRTVSKEDINDTLKKHKPDAVGISLITNCAIRDAVKVSKASKKHGIPVVFGGTLATVIYEPLLREGAADYVSLGEGEATWLDFADSYEKNLPFDKVEGMVFLKNGKIFFTPNRELLDLSVLPELDWSLIDPENFFQVGNGCKKQLAIYWSKGCSGSCTFCYNKQFHRSCRRQRPMETLISEMRYLVEKHGADGFDFADDHLFATRTQMLEFCNKLIESSLKVAWHACMRIDAVKSVDDYKLMYESGCRSLLFGIETGSEKTMKLIGKRVNLQKIENEISMCVEAGIQPVPTIIIGFPGETAEDIKATVELTKRIKDANCYYQIYTPIPGSDMHEMLVKSGKIAPSKSLKEYSKIKFAELSVKNYSDVKTSEIRTIWKFFRLKMIFFGADKSDDEQFIKTVMNALKAMSKKGFIYFFKQGFSTAKSLLELITVFLHPGIRRKYGLYFNK